MDVDAREAFWTALQASVASGRTVVFCTHYLEEADAHAGRIVVLRDGSIVADGTPEDVKAAAGVRRHITFRYPRASRHALRQLSAVTEVTIRDEKVTLTTTDPDTTIWALYDLRHDISENSEPPYFRGSGARPCPFHDPFDGTACRSRHHKNHQVKTGAARDLNPEPADQESAALPIELAALETV